MYLDKGSVDLQRARQQLTIRQLAERYGCSETRMKVILNSKELTPVCIGRLAEALGVDAAELVCSQN